MAIKAPHRRWIEVDPEDMRAFLLKAHAEGSAESSETQQRDVVWTGLVLHVVARFARRAFALEDAERGYAQQVELM